MTKLFDIQHDIYKNGRKANVMVILIQIDEAHSTAWPMAINHLLNVEQPEPHKTFNDRLERVKQFMENYNPPYPVYVDNWDNEFAELFKAWPDKYHCINKNLQVVAKSEYHSDDKREATIIEDCTDVLERLIK